MTAVFFGFYLDILTVFCSSMGFQVDTYFFIKCYLPGNLKRIQFDVSAASEACRFLLGVSPSWEKSRDWYFVRLNQPPISSVAYLAERCQRFRLR